nr:fibronectin type-III domain-containing protein 3A-like isoform X2 [Lepeophtheirus salmonis]
MIMEEEEIICSNPEDEQVPEILSPPSPLSSAIPQKEELYVTSFYVPSGAQHIHHPPLIPLPPPSLHGGPCVLEEGGALYYSPPNIHPGVYVIHHTMTTYPPTSNYYEGPAQIRMVSTNSAPPQAIPMQPPPGHIVQQILDQNGTLQHVILSLDPSVNPPNQPYVPIHPYGLPTGGNCISNGQAAQNPAGAHSPFGAPPPTYVPSNGGAPLRNPAHPLVTTQYPPPVISTASSSVPSSSSNTTTFTTSPCSSTPGGWAGGHHVSGGSGGGTNIQPGGGPTNHSTSSSSTNVIREERRIRGPTHERLLKKSKNRLVTESIVASNVPTNQGQTNTTSPPSSPSKRNLHRESKIYGKGNKEQRGAPSSSSGPSSSECRHLDDSEESGVGHEEEEEKETQQLLLELLSNIQAPKESNVTARGAVISWEPPVLESSDPKFEGLEPIPPSEFTYEVLLSDKGKEGRYRSVFKSESLNCRLPDLRPNTEYHIRIHTLLDNIKGGASEIVSFRTLPSEPDTPFPPKVASKSKTSINLRWNAPSDNGSSIQNYILEFDEGKSSPFSPIFTGRAKNYNVTKLSPATPYRFRLIAVNEFGQSRPSETIIAITQGAAPSKPVAPGLMEATKSSLDLLWSKRLTDSEFVLQRNDMTSGHGYISVYSGPDNQSVSTGLRRNTFYKFRLRAVNNEGESQWSDEVSYSTLPDKPEPPVKVAPKGKLHSNSFKVRWDPPGDDGGSKVTQYNLELDEGLGWRTLYQGMELEYICDGLTPGKQYFVRVSCQSSGGVSEFSDVCTIITEPVRPDQCPPPRLHGKPKADHLYLKWSWPEYDGGSRITDFEIDMTSPDNLTRTAYKGRDNECAVASLLPGRPYLFQVRAHNKSGAGPWSDSLEVVSGAGAPGQPKEPKFTIRSPYAVIFTWEAPINNGAIITEYCLEIANISLSRAYQVSDSSSEDESSNNEEENDEEVQDNDDSSDDSSSDEEKEYDASRNSDSYDESDSEEDTSSDAAPPYSSSSKRKTIETKSLKSNSQSRIQEVKEPEFISIYVGPNTSFESRSLSPASTYLTRLVAFNSAGKSPPSNSVTKLVTPAAPPAQITSIRLRKSGSTWLRISWKMPDPQGEDITHYKVDMGTVIVPTNGSESNILLSDLKPDSAYNIRVQAINSIGTGPFSQIYRFSTMPLPPAPPKIECINANHNSIKLKWGDSKSVDLCHYNLEMENSRNQFQTVYSGSIVSHKINKLSENTTYRFRITASNEAGHGPYSAVYEITTLYAHPPPLKSVPRVSSITSDGCLVEWTPVKMLYAQGTLNYKVQLTKVKDHDSKIIYSGGDVSFRISGLEPRSDYTIKVLPVRVPAPGLAELVGPSSSPGIFTTLGGDLGRGVPGSSSMSLLGSSSKLSCGSQKPEKKAFTDQQWAFFILVGFSVFAMAVAVVMHQIIGWSKEDESGD